MKKFLITLAFCLAPMICHAATQQYIPSTSTYQGNSSVINIASASIRNLTPSTMTVNNQLQLLSPFMIGLSSYVANFTATPASGGSLVSGTTYFYKVFPFTPSGSVSVYSPEVTALATPSNKTVNMSWASVPKAAFYRVTRGTHQGAYDGYWQVTTSTYNDTGAAFTSGSSVVANGENYWGTTSGEIRIPANIGGINWIDYTDGQIHGHIAVTSAGEFEVSTGSGTNQIYIFEDSAFRQWAFMGMGPGPYLQFNNGTNGNEGYGAIVANPLILAQGGARKFEVNTSSLQANIPLNIISSAAVNMRNLLLVNYASGNPYHNYSSLLDSFSSGLVNAGRYYAISVSSSPDTMVALKVSTGGFITQPLQASFRAETNVANAQNNVTGDGTQYTVQFRNISFDQSTNFDTISTFTATVNGRYGFSSAVYTFGYVATNTGANVFLNTTQKNYKVTFSSTSNTSDRSLTFPFTIVPMNAGDKAWISIQVNGTGKGVSIDNATTDGFFSGCLLQ